MSKCCGGCWSWCFCFTVLLIVAAITYSALTLSMVKLHPVAPPVPGPPGAIHQKYADALRLATQFLDVQKSGKLSNNSISWRGDSALNDGSEVKADLSKGMYVGGDNMKFNFPMAFTATMLSWAILEYGDHMDKVKQREPVQDSLKWITDYLLNCHPSENVLYIQVGDPEADHACWQKPEAMTEPRPVKQVNTSSPGADVAAETAAAFASASLVFKKNDLAYSNLLLKHARQLFSFANASQVSYSDSVPEVKKYYDSSGYLDEIMWAGLWLYQATEEEQYLYSGIAADGIMSYVADGKVRLFDWDNKHSAAMVLMSRVSFFSWRKPHPWVVAFSMQVFIGEALNFMCNLVPESHFATPKRTPRGLIWLSETNPLQHSLGAAFLALVYSDYMLTTQVPTIYCEGKLFYAQDLRNFAASQVDYILGNNPMKMSYVVGYGNKYPEFVHHRGASIPSDVKSECNGFKWLESKRPNPNLAVGAVVGGPFENDTYIDDRNNKMKTEPTTYNNALLVGVLSGLLTKSSVVESFI